MIISIILAFYFHDCAKDGQGEYLYSYATTAASAAVSFIGLLVAAQTLHFFFKSLKPDDTHSS